MNYIAFDDAQIRNQLKPFTFTKPVAGIRCGILTIGQKWEKTLETTISYLTENYLQEKFTHISTNDNIYINGSVCPNSSILRLIHHLKDGEKLINQGIVLAIRTSQTLTFPIDYTSFNTVELLDVQSTIAQNLLGPQPTIIQNLPDIYLKNGDQIKADFPLITKGRQSQTITDPFTRIYAPENVFVEAGASIKAVIINAENGPVYIGKNATIQEGAIIIGPFSADEGSIVAWGAKMRANTTLGPFCRAGGEVGNSILSAYSNKAHDGFLGNSVIGEWCNLGANTNNSNLKNDYSDVKLYSYVTNRLEKSGELFCGLFMGDYTKAGISTMFNTGTVAGVCSNIFGAGFQDKHIPSFKWGGVDSGYALYRFDKAMQVINETMKRRDKQLSGTDLQILQYIHDTESSIW
ncbi:putative sugar nucleotidyl transferase [Emticicia sp. C21]|uniref:putative sugar nucleotidyl transferase n=1 Tax=Emticicia sp. C21 TaxID=2302915 RepID=UPI000E344C25|nr:putative sugar nucleotidyl transferase [Emticicia sp. C21]RFS16027.1 glucose-1-phosphate thymidylyltransferase [Emticicia sp. C21]